MMIDLIAFKWILYLATFVCSFVPVSLAILWLIDFLKKDIW